MSPAGERPGDSAGHLRAIGVQPVEEVPPATVVLVPEEFAGGRETIGYKCYTDEGHGHILVPRLSPKGLDRIAVPLGVAVRVLATPGEAAHAVIAGDTARLRRRWSRRASSGAGAGEGAPSAPLAEIRELRDGP